MGGDDERERDRERADRGVERERLGSGREAGSSTATLNRRTSKLSMR